MNSNQESDLAASDEAACPLTFSEETHMGWELGAPIAALRPMTQEEIARQREAYEAARAHIERMRAHRGGVPLTESWPIIREARDERPGSL